MIQSALKSLAVVLATGGALAILASAPAYAGFITDPNPGGTKLYNNVANSNVTSFTANVGNAAGAAIDVDTTGNSQTGSGFAIIKPYGDSLLTQLVFTPQDPTLFSAFNFRGQIESQGFDGIVNVSVVDLTNVTYNFIFSGLAGPNADFASIGVYSPDGDTIKSLTITADAGESFKTIKQIQLTNVSQTTEVPEPLTLSLFAAGLAGMAGLRRRKSLFGATVA